MEFSISGTCNKKEKKGIRPTLNSYMCADALCISQFAAKAGLHDVSARYKEKHDSLRKLINEKLWDGDFYKALHYDRDNFDSAFETDIKTVVRELIGYIPWYFNISDYGGDIPFSYLESPSHFYTPFGITTAEQNHPDFLFEVKHECLWNGYIWPFATSQTLTALRNVCRQNPDNSKFKNMFTKILIQYAQSHYITLENGKTQPWIDEVKHQYRDEWSSRTILKNLGWRADKGGVERGKDYNHSTFCDLVISGIVGVTVQNGELVLNPIIPESWEYFKLDNLHFDGSIYTIVYDKNGRVYGHNCGLTLFRDGQAVKTVLTANNQTCR